MRRAACCLAAVIGIGACGGPTLGKPEPPARLLHHLRRTVDPRPFLGCWRAAYAKPHPERPWNAWTFRLDTVDSHPTAARSGWSSTDRGAVERTWWRLLRRDRIQVVSGDGLHGLALTFETRGDSLVGFTETVTDIVGAPRHRERIAARRVSCPDPSHPDSTRSR